MNFVPSSFNTQVTKIEYSFELFACPYEILRGSLLMFVGNSGSKSFQLERQLVQSAKATENLVRCALVPFEISIAEERAKSDPEPLTSNG